MTDTLLEAIREVLKMGLHDFQRLDVSYLQDALRQCMERMEAESKEVAVIKDAIVDAAYDYKAYIIEDNAPMNLIDYMQKAVDAAILSNREQKA